MDRGTWKATYNPWDHKQLDMTERLTLSLYQIPVFPQQDERGLLSREVESKRPYAQDTGQRQEEKVRAQHGRKCREESTS